MTVYEAILDFYIMLQKVYKWLPSDIDKQEVELMFDMINLQNEQEAFKNQVFIDDIF